jgi:hypothetical protein
MKNKLSLLSLLILIPFFNGLSQAVISKRDPTVCTSIAKDVIGKYDKGEYALIPEKFDQHLKEGLTPAKLEASWTETIKLLGPYKGITDVQSQMFVGSTIIICVCQFGEWQVDFKTVYNGAGKISGLYFLPHLESPAVAKDSIKK